MERNNNNKSTSSLFGRMSARASFISKKEIKVSELSIDLGGPEGKMGYGRYGTIELLISGYDPTAERRRYHQQWVQGGILIVYLFLLLFSLVNNENEQPFFR